MFNVINSDVILPQYPCGNRGPGVSASLHGETWAVWKLVDDLDKHVLINNNKTKIKCQTCHTKLFQSENDKALSEYDDKTEAV